MKIQNYFYRGCLSPKLKTLLITQILYKIFNNYLIFKEILITEYIVDLLGCILLHVKPEINQD